MSAPEGNQESQLDNLGLVTLPVDPGDRKLMSGLRIQVAFMIFTIGNQNYDTGGGRISGRCY